MSLYPPVAKFGDLKPVTMTIIASLNVSEFNLAAIFALLPVTKQSLPEGIHLQRKQGKIKLPPELNKPGEIISMRWDNHVRGIVRSEVVKSFPHSIILDIGTSKQIISMKLSKTIELTGPRSAELAQEASESIICLVRQCQDDLNLVRKYPELSTLIQEKYLDSDNDECDVNFVEELLSLSQYESVDPDDIHRIWSFYKRTSGETIHQKNSFFKFLNNFSGNLFTGELRLGKFEYEMVNLHFHLGYTINQARLTEVMNEYPFVAIFNTLKGSLPVKVYYYYTKKERSTGNSVKAKHTIQINKSGHVRHSGPNLEAMKPVYYAFIKRTLLNRDKIRSTEHSTHKIKTGNQVIFSPGEWKAKLDSEQKLISRIINNEIAIATGENETGSNGSSQTVKSSFLLDVSDSIEFSTEDLPPGMVSSSFPSDLGQDFNEDLSPLDFDYKPLISMVK